MTNELLPLKIRYSTQFHKELKRLRKKYQSIQKDVTQFIDSIKTDFFPGDRLEGIEGGLTVYKARIQNSDNNKGKSGGYRAIYLYEEPETIILITIFSKSEQSDINVSEINSVIAAYQQELESESEDE